MSFMRDNEWFLLMDVPTAAGTVMTDNDIIMLRDAGIETTMYFVNHWGDVESAMGVYDWSKIDEYVSRMRRLKMKTLIMSYTSAPSWMPVEWYAHTARGPQVGVLDPWNMDAMAYSNGYLRRLVERYNVPGESMVINSWLTHGETIGLNEAMFFSPSAIASYEKRHGVGARPQPNTPATETWTQEYFIGMLMAQQLILVENVDRDIWTMLHPMIAQFGYYGNGCKWIEDVLANYHAIPGACIHQIYYTWIQWPHLWPQMRRWSEAFGTRVFGGAEYAEGIHNTLPRAVQEGLRGQIIAPCHPYTGHNAAEPWMADNIRWGMQNCGR